MRLIPRFNNPEIWLSPHCLGPMQPSIGPFWFNRGHISGPLWKHPFLNTFINQPISILGNLHSFLRRPFDLANCFDWILWCYRLSLIEILAFSGTSCLYMLPVELWEPSYKSSSHPADRKCTDIVFKKWKKRWQCTIKHVFQT